MKAEQKARQDELQAKETLEAPEAEELKVLLALPQEIEEEDPEAAFGDAWDDLDDNKSADELSEAEKIEAKEKAEKEAKELAEKEAAELAAKTLKDQSTEASKTDGDLLNLDPDKSDKTLDTKKIEPTPDARDTKITELEHKMASWDGRLKAADKRAAEAEQKLKEAEAKGQSTESDKNASPDEDAKKLSAFFKEFPDLESPMKSVAEKIATKLFNDKMSKVDEIVASQDAVKDTLDADADARHMATIEAAHADWKTIYDSGALETWIKKQPEYLQPKLQEIISNGSAREIIGMFDSYKRASGKGTKQEPNTAEADAAKAAKIKALEAVAASTGGPKEPAVKIAKDDFDGAWDSLEKKDTQKT